MRESVLFVFRSGATLFLILRASHKLRVSENRELRTEFLYQVQEVAGGLIIMIFVICTLRKMSSE